MLKNLILLPALMAAFWPMTVFAQTNSAAPASAVAPQAPAGTEEESSATTAEKPASEQPAAPDPVLPPGFHRDKPAYIIIKTDDLKPNASGHLSANWQELVDAINAHKIKANIGVICTGLEGTTPPFDKFFQWVKDLHATGNFEFWLHAYDHMNHIVNGLSYAEMDGHTYDELKQKFDLCQKLAQDKLGFTFNTFGPPGFSAPPGVPKEPPHPNPNLDRAVQDDPYLTVWLYPSPIDDAGHQVEAQGKVTILDRVWQVNIEQPLFKPNYAKFVEGYAKYPDREYFVIQGHPGHWKPDGFAQFGKILDFLQRQNAIFVTATEMAAILKKEHGGVAASAPAAAGSAAH
jgi:peptidoglycan/xylan/chitin deacetylase (PgdA/CDA1 family)